MSRRTRRSFTPEFRARTVELIESSGRSIPDICRELDLTASAVRRWVEQAEVDRGRKDGVTRAEREEREHLRRENRILREEREILKYAAAFFASETR
jgi:transposase